MNNDSDFDNAWWQARWTERNDSLKRVLGETDPPGFVTSVNWPRPELIIPGACILHWDESVKRRYFLDITLGLSQPVSKTDRPRGFEVGICSKSPGVWQNDLLFQIFLHCSESGDILQPGDCFQGGFFIGANGSLLAGLHRPPVPMIGQMCAFYLWPNYHFPMFNTSHDTFWVLSMVCITHSEMNLVRSHSIAHVLLGLQMLGVELLCDPFRQSLLESPNGISIWNQIQGLDTNEAIARIRFQQP